MEVYLGGIMRRPKSAEGRRENLDGKYAGQ
jgi:hypothetical protein